MMLNVIYHKTIEIPEAIIHLRSDMIVHIIYKEGVVIDVPLQQRVLEKFNELCEGKKLPFLFDAMDHVTVTKEAKLNAIEMENKTPVLATAVFAKSLAYKLIADFYLKINKPKKPFKVFRKKEDAITWLLTFHEKTNENKKSKTNYFI